MISTKYKSIDECLICGNKNLRVILDLGVQALTGVFPSDRAARITSGPLVLKKCTGNHDACGLLQLGHSYNLAEMYGNNYGYRSGLNITMVRHLQSKIRKLSELRGLSSGDLVLDIGSNDGTSLAAYGRSDIIMVGMDPTAKKFEEYYPEGSHLIADFFTHEIFNVRFPGKKAKIITSFAMFYDLERPLDFMRQIREIMADDGIWCFEQSYMPSMLATKSYDTICHEHLEFYGLKQIHWMTQRAGLKIINVDFNDVNGGSFSVTVSKDTCIDYGESKDLEKYIAREEALNLESEDGFEDFVSAVVEGRRELRTFMEGEIKRGMRFAGLGASTKGNVLLQYCGLDSSWIECIGDVNEDKFGKFTPGTGIPILSEQEVLSRKYDYYLVLPWHFRDYFDASPRYFGVRLLYPLPKMSIRDIRPLP